MASSDRDRWDEVYRERAVDAATPALPAHFERFSALFATAGTATEIAAGDGRASVWLAHHGVEITAYDVSPVAIAQAVRLAERHGCAERCRFVVADLDDGLPRGPAVDLVLCNLFRDARLDHPVLDRLVPSGTLALAALSEVGAEPGRFRAKPGELVRAFSELELVDSFEGDGIAWIVGRKP